MSNLKVHPMTLARVLNDSRQLWKDSDEAPAVRQIVYDLANAIAIEDADFDERAFVLGCGFEWPRALTSTQTFTRGSRVSVGTPFSQDGGQAPDGHEGIWYVALQRGTDLLLSKSRTVAVADEQGEVWMNIGRCART